MKTYGWAKTLLTAYRYLERIADALDSMIESRGLLSRNVSGINYSINNIFTLSEKIINLSERKVKLINLKVLTEKCLKKCGDKTACLLIEKYIDGRKNDDIAKRNDIAYRTLFRRLSLGEQKFQSVLDSMGFTEEKLDEYLSCEKWILEIKKRQETLRKGETFEFSSFNIDRLAVV